MGRIHIPAWRDEPETVVEGIHELIVTSSVFDRVQQRFQKPKTGRKWKLIPELFLCGQLLCPNCDELLTGSGSRGNGGKYFYYHSHHCGKVRYRAEQAHADLSRHLRSVEIAPEIPELYTHILKDLTNSEREESDQRRKRLESQISEVEEKLFTVDEAYIDKRIEGDSYTRLKQRYATNLNDARIELHQLNENSGNLGEKLRYAVSCYPISPAYLIGLPFRLEERCWFEYGRIISFTRRIVFEPTLRGT